jgi:hypothetical protein
MTAGISTGDKVITNITTGRSIVLPTFLPSFRETHRGMCFSEGRATPRGCHLVAVAIRSGLFGEASGPSPTSRPSVLLAPCIEASNDRRHRTHLIARIVTSSRPVISTCSSPSH